ncbi:MAG TPA: hypothetical protein VFO85_17530 [Vicinamibacteria bacterium]|nr:hypothetical protein [Vicinamibacteria bacterium]
MRRTTLSGTLIVALMLAGCQTITEEMPNETAGGGPTGPNPAPVPVVVVPVPIPTPPPATPPPPPPAPQQPSGPPTGGGGGGGGDIPTNTNPVAKLTAKIYFVECYGQIVPYPPAPVGCRVHLDVTPTDARNQHTQAQGTLRWTYTNTNLFTLSGNSIYNPVLDVKHEGDLECWAEVDGIRSNTVHVSIR